LIAALVLLVIFVIGFIWAMAQNSELKRREKRQTQVVVSGPESAAFDRSSIPMT